LDCCAAPGGKTRVIAERNPSSDVLAVELHPPRANLLRMLVSAPNVKIVAADMTAFPIAQTFDRVLADVPCSGTGTLARNPEIKWRLRPFDLADLQMRQVAILKSAMNHLSPGGRLVYSTCSLEREENSDVVEMALKDTAGFEIANAHGELKILKDEGELVWPDLNSLVSGPYLRTLPGVHQCDGFFAAILMRA
jgi:16S rRNA (cytosine967-C5)-methyltransferase